MVSTPHYYGFTWVRGVTARERFSNYLLRDYNSDSSLFLKSN
jgi:hypothetical protein